jgi:hypothetical protein
MAVGELAFDLRELVTLRVFNELASQLMIKSTQSREIVCKSGGSFFSLE